MSESTKKELTDWQRGYMHAMEQVRLMAKESGKFKSPLHDDYSEGYMDGMTRIYEIVEAYARGKQEDCKNGVRYYYDLVGMED